MFYAFLFPISSSYYYAFYFFFLFLFFLFFLRDMDSISSKNSPGSY